MRDIAMHILDIVENSVRAKSPCVKLSITEDLVGNTLSFTIEDKGGGIPPDMLKTIRNPFTTSRSTRKVGLGLALLAQSCEQCGGTLEIHSTVGKGTTVVASMVHDHIDRPPLGDMVNTLHVMVVMHPDIDFLIVFTRGKKKFVLNTVEIKEVLEGVPMSEPSVSAWLKQHIQEGVTCL